MLQDPTLSGSLFERLGQLYEKGTKPSLEDFQHHRALRGFQVQYPDLGPTNMILVVENDNGTKYFANQFDSNDLDKILHWSRYTDGDSYSPLALSEPLQAATEDFIRGVCTNHMSVKKTSLSNGKRLLVMDHWATGNCDVPVDSIAWRRAYLLP